MTIIVWLDDFNDLRVEELDNKSQAEEWLSLRTNANYKAVVLSTNPEITIEYHT